MKKIEMNRKMGIRVLTIAGLMIMQMAISVEAKGVDMEIALKTIKMENLAFMDNVQTNKSFNFFSETAKYMNYKALIAKGKEDDWTEKRSMAIARMVAEYEAEEMRKAAEEEAKKAAEEEKKVAEEAARLAAEVDEPEQEPVMPEEMETNVVSLGTYRVTGYCPCEYCCGKTDAITASGTLATAGRTIAMDDSMPFGTKVVINGKAYTVEDRGGAIKGEKIDMYFDSHDEALEWGVKYIEVFSE